jgi:hypothetical protein
MRRLITIFSIIVLVKLFACVDKYSNTISVAFENSSSKDLEFLIYDGTILVSKTFVKRGVTSISYTTSMLNLDLSRKNKELKVKIVGRSDSTRLILNTDSLTSEKLINIHFGETIIRKGTKVAYGVLERDTIAAKAFYIQVMNKKDFTVH